MTHGTVLVVGLGVMGRGIARLFAGSGFDVRVTDADAATTDAGLARLRQEAEDDGQPVTIASTTLHAELADDLVVEAVSEDAGVKHELVRRLGALASPGTVLATNTSSLSVDELATSSGRPDRFLGLHFFNPPTRMHLVELVVGARTSSQVVDRVARWVAAVGREAVRCVDSPGFVVNRTCRPLYMEGQHLVEQGVAPAAIDVLARRALGHRMGPLETLDLAGLHVHVASCESAWTALGDPRYAPSPYTRRLVRAGHVGRASGRGFYDYANDRPSVQQRPLVDEPGTARCAVTTRGAGAHRRPRPADPGDAVVLWMDDGASTDDDVTAVRDLVDQGRVVVVDSSDGRWLQDLPDGVGWIHVHAGDGGIVEVVDDALAGVVPDAPVGAVVAELGLDAVTVPALPGLVVDRLWSGLVNEATLLVEQGIATADDIDRALRLGMGHARGPFEELEGQGASRTVAVLDMLAARTHEPRYRATAWLRRRAAGERRERAS